MESLYQAEGQLTDFLSFCWRHRGKMSLTACIVMAVTLIYLSHATKRYLSEAKLYIRIGRETVALDPTATTGQYTAVSDTRESDVNTVEEVIASQSVAERIVDRFGPYAILERDESAGPLLGERLDFLNSYNLNPLRVYS